MKLEFIFVFFALVAAIDKITGNRFKLGDEFDKGIMTSGALIVSMSGMIVLSPVLAKWLCANFEPLLNCLKMDTSVLAYLFPVDAGGASMAYELSTNQTIRAYNGIIVSSMFGATICPVIPLSLQIVNPKYHEDVLIGLLCGIATIPVGCIVAGIIMGCALFEIIINTLLIFILSVILCIGLWKIPDISRKILGAIGKILMAFVTIGLILGIILTLTGIEMINGVASIDESFLIIGNISIILAGVFPMLSIFSRLFNKVFIKLGYYMKLDNVSVLGLITTLANSIPVFSMIEKMHKKGRIMNMAFAVSAAYVFGDHFAFVLSFDRTYVFPMIFGKLISGFMALILSEIIYRRILSKNKK